MEPKLDPDVADEVPWSETITDYDRGHMVTYLRLLDAERDGAAWEEAARLVLGCDPAASSARHCWESHLQRARWMTTTGYKNLLAAESD